MCLLYSQLLNFICFSCFQQLMCKYSSTCFTCAPHSNFINTCIGFDSMQGGMTITVVVGETPPTTSTHSLLSAIYIYIHSLSFLVVAILFIFLLLFLFLSFFVTPLYYILSGEFSDIAQFS